MNLMKCIAVLTFHRPINYGAALQAVALCKYLEEKGEKVVLVDYRHPRIEQSRKLIGSDQQKRNSVFSKIKGLIRDFLFYSTEHYRINLFDAFVSSNTTLSAPCYTEAEIRHQMCEYSTLLVGSDLVWNWDLDNELNDVFFLNFAYDFVGVKASYASSIGTSYIPLEYLPKYQNYINNFDYISVREKTAENLLKNLTKKNVTTVLDPTLLIDAKTWSQMEKVVDCPEDYVVFYILEITDKVIEVINFVKENLKLPIVYFTRDTYYGSLGINSYKCGPAEFLYLLHHAKLIVTNSFHGTVFSLLFNRNFITIPHSTRGSRMIDLLKNFGMEDRIISETSQMFDLISKNVDYTRFNSDLSLYREKSESYLDMVLGKEES